MCNPGLPQKVLLETSSLAIKFYALINDSRPIVFPDRSSSNEDVDMPRLTPTTIVRLMAASLFEEPF